MAEGLKKPNLIWIIAVAVVVIAIGVAMYMLYRRITYVDLEGVKRKDAMARVAVDVDGLKTELAHKEKQLQDITKENAALRESNTKIKYQIKELTNNFNGNMGGMNNLGLNGQGTVGGKKRMMNCDDGSCAMPARGGIVNVDDE